MELTNTDSPTNPLALLGGMDLKEIDTDKVGKLLELQEQWEAREAKKAFNKALASFQAEMPTVFKSRSESRGKYHYAAYEDIMRVARPILHRNGLSVSFAQEESADSITIRCQISHVDGHSETTPFTLPKDGPIQTKDGRNVTSQAQAQGSANSYAKRYCLCNALDIVVSDEDDDGQALVIQYISTEQVQEIEKLLDKVDDLTARDKMLKWAGAETVEQIPETKFNGVVSALKAKI